MRSAGLADSAVAAASSASTNSSSAGGGRLFGVCNWDVLRARIPVAAVSAGFFRGVKRVVGSPNQTGDVVVAGEIRNAQAASYFE